MPGKFGPSTYIEGQEEKGASSQSVSRFGSSSLIEQPPETDKGTTFIPSLVPGSLSEIRKETGEPIKDEFREAVVKSIPNIPKSGVQFVKDIVTPLLHPVKTAKAIGNLAVGIAEKAIPGEQEKEKFANEFGDFLKDRYGSTESILETIEKDPVGVLAGFQDALVPENG